MESRITPDMARAELQRRQQAREELQRRSLQNERSEPSQEMANTFLGQLPRNLPQFQSGSPQNQQLISELMGAAAGNPGLKMIQASAPLLKAGASKVANYMQPGKVSEQFRSTLGEGTSAENIQNISNIAQGAKQSAREEALALKRPLYEKEGESLIYGNPEAPFESAYLSSKKVTAPYHEEGKLMNLHESFKNNPTLSNYDALQSALKEELRAMKKRARLSDTAAPKVDQLQNNIENLNADIGRFVKTLPEDIQHLESQFRNKYRNYAETYEIGKKDVGPSLTLRRLAEGKHDLVTDEQVAKLFSHPTKADKKAILDMGPTAARNALYAALQRVDIGDADKMAKTILDLKRTKGFDKIVTPEIEQWAKNMVKQVRNSNLIAKTIGSLGGGAVGGAIWGPYGAAAGATLPWIKEAGVKGAKYLSEKMRR